MIVMGFAGYVYARNILLSQWREAFVLKLQRAAHQVDMRLMRVKDWVRIFRFEDRPKKGTMNEIIY